MHMQLAAGSTQIARSSVCTVSKGTHIIPVSDLNKINTLSELATNINITINILNVTNATVAPCIETINPLADAICKKSKRWKRLQMSTE